MGYPNRLLLDGEQIVLDLRPHWWFFAKHIAAGIPVLALAVFALTLDGDTGTIVGWLALVVLVVWLLWFLVRLANWLTTHFVLTSERLIFRRGLISKHGRDVPLGRVNNIDMHQTVFERVLRAGDLLIESAGETGQQRFTDIRRPEHVQREINRQVELHDNRERGNGRGAVGQSAPEQIAALAQLRDQGLITEAEFQAKKTDLLGRM
ncbi:MAG: PH domain-containing protein [Sporichthyaceae bacterium]